MYKQTNKKFKVKRCDSQGRTRCLCVIDTGKVKTTGDLDNTPYTRRMCLTRPLTRIVGTRVWKSSPKHKHGTSPNNDLGL